MPCDEAFYRHYHKRLEHTHPREHVGPGGGHPREEGKAEPQPHVHEATLHAHPYDPADPHHRPEAILVGISVYVLQDRKETWVLDDVDYLEISDDHLVVHNVLGQERIIAARLRRIHFVQHGRVMIFLEKG